jgi:dipeptidyl aminopeptidase/acylaminoacyl peptidase
VVARSQSESLPAHLLSAPEPITWAAEDGSLVHGLLYRPQGAPTSATERPPLIVLVHGGPTGQATAGFDDRAQFFCTRGYAVLQVNYRGSAGYGRAYRNALRQQWGVYDVADAVSGARHLADTGVVDVGRMVIMGGSAGGYTVLLALIHHPGAFKAGISLYGVTNLFTLAADTHKFEARYLDSMIGPLPETAARYRERSPIFSAGRIRDALAVYQGEEDRVVPLAQAETLVAALRRAGTPHIYERYPGEGHGWRKAETIATFYQSVLAFLKEHVLFA